MQRPPLTLNSSQQHQTQNRPTPSEHHHNSRIPDNLAGLRAGNRKQRQRPERLQHVRPLITIRNRHHHRTRRHTSLRARRKRDRALNPPLPTTRRHKQIHNPGTKERRNRNSTTPKPRRHPAGNLRNKTARRHHPHDPSVQRKLHDNPRAPTRSLLNSANIPTRRSMQHQPERQHQHVDLVKPRPNKIRKQPTSINPAGTINPRTTNSPQQQPTNKHQRQNPRHNPRSLQPTNNTTATPILIITPTHFTIITTVTVTRNRRHIRHNPRRQHHQNQRNQDNKPARHKQIQRTQQRLRQRDTALTKPRQLLSTQHARSPLARCHRQRRRTAQPPVPHRHPRIPTRHNQRPMHTQTTRTHPTNNITRKQRTNNQPKTPVHKPSKTSNKPNQPRSRPRRTRQTRKPSDQTAHRTARCNRVPRHKNQTHLHPERQKPPQPLRTTPRIQQPNNPPSQRQTGP